MDLYLYIQTIDGGDLEVRDSKSRDRSEFIDISVYDSLDDGTYVALSRVQAEALRDHLIKILG